MKDKQEMVTNGQWGRKEESIGKEVRVFESVSRNSPYPI
jgi:hypothetical protein